MRWWRERWRQDKEKLAAAEEEQQVTDKKLMVLIKQVLEDRPRSGTSRLL